jgi:hypothetical protein
MPDAPTSFPRRVAASLAVQAEIAGMNRLVLVRFEVIQPRRRPAALAETRDPKLWIYPLRETRTRERKTVTRRVEVALLFGAPIDDTRDLPYWEAAADAYIDALQGLPMDGAHWDGVETESLWDPSAADSARFVALYVFPFVSTYVLP